MELGAGYTPVRSLHCGVCSTDLARRFLPYPLPQIIGHEVVGEKDGKPVVVEINASPLARGIATEDPFSLHGLHTHSPQRITLGIDRLPGGFAPFFLAPVDAIVSVPPSVSALAASLTEPFAASLQGVDATPIRNGDSVAVLGPRRLGMLILAALSGFRKEKGIQFEITALIRHDNLKDLCLRMGADRVQDSNTAADGSFDVVFDTTGKTEGFAHALRMAKRCVSLKSTNGQETLGLKHLTDLVVDEMAIVPFSAKYLTYTWPSESEPRSNHNIFLSPGVSREVETEIRRAAPNAIIHRMSAAEAAAKIRGGWNLEGSPVPRFDLAVASTLAETDQIIRPAEGVEFSILRPRGAVLFAGPAVGPLERAVTERGLEIRTSRCGDFHRTMKLLEEQPWIAKAFEEQMITHRFSLDHIGEAFETAADSARSVKVIVDAS
jgi:threonine dehydrogenase-like Zn-dependent dehydrogenase